MELHTHSDTQNQKLLIGRQHLLQTVKNSVIYPDLVFVKFKIQLWEAGGFQEQSIIDALVRGCLMFFRCDGDK